MAKEYQTFVRKYGDLYEGERDIFIKDLTSGPRKYDTKQVRAVIYRSPKLAPDADVLWVRSETGVQGSQPWGIKILEELKPFVAGRPWTDVFAAQKN